MYKNNTITLISPLISFIAGIYSSKIYHTNNIILAITILVSAFLLFLFKKNSKIIILQTMLCLTIFASGLFLIQYQKENHLSILKTLQNNKIKAIAIVKNKENRARPNQGEILELQIKKIIKNIGNYQEANININVYTKTDTNLEVRDKIKIENIKIPIISNKQNLMENPTHLEYQIKENVLCSIFCSKLFYKKIKSSKWNIAKWINHKKNITLHNLKQKLLPSTFYYFSYIFLGNKKIGDNKYLRDIFNRWGISHYLARSGLHIVLFIFIWSLILTLIPMGLYIKKILLIITCLTYGIFSWTSISFSRAFYLFIIYESGKLLNQQTNFLHLLSIICIFILLVNPIQLFFLDFQLSFSLAFALGLLGQIRI